MINLKKLIYLAERFVPRLHLLSVFLDSLKRRCLENPVWRKNIVYRKSLYARCLGKNSACKGVCKKLKHVFCFHSLGTLATSVGTLVINNIHGSRQCPGKRCTAEKFA